MWFFLASLSPPTKKNKVWTLFGATFQRGSIVLPATIPHPLPRPASCDPTSQKKRCADRWDQSRDPSPLRSRSNHAHAHIAASSTTNQQQHASHDLCGNDGAAPFISGVASLVADPWELGTIFVRSGTGPLCVHPW